MKKQNLSLIDSIKAANSKISILTEEVGSHNVEKMREFYKKPELSGKFFYQMGQIKGSSDSSHIFEINVGKRQIRHTTTLKLNNEFLDRLKIDSR